MGVMEGKKVLPLLVVLLLLSAAAVKGYGREREWEEEEGMEEEEEEEEEEDVPYGRRGGRGELFMLGKPEVVARTEAGIFRVARGYKWKGVPSTMHIGFIDMEPNSLFLPQYLDAHLIIFIRKGEARLGRIYKDEMVERDLRMGDIYRIPAGFSFYIENVGRGQSLQIICSIDTSESLGPLAFQSFFIGGGSNPVSVLSGFDINTLTTALNVTDEEVDALLSRQSGGPFIRMVEDIPERAKRLASIMQKTQQRMQKYHQFANDEVDNDGEFGEEATRKAGKVWSWMRLVKFMFGMDDRDQNENKDQRRREKTGKRKVSGGGPEPLNLYDRKPDFENTYGKTVAIDENDYEPLKHSGVGVYLVILTAGSMLAPHLNPRANELGVVIGGSGSLEVVFPNGTSAMNVELNVDDGFWIPQHFPFCQIASRAGSLEFFGFTTSSQRNLPQFLVGASSILQSMNGPELAASYGVSEERLDELIRAQRESIILPSWPPEKRGETGEGQEERGYKKKKEEEEEGGREPVLVMRRGGTP